MRCKISDDSSLIRGTVSPRRSLWITLVTPFCVLATALRLLGAAASLHHALWFVLLGLLLGVFYLWLFLWNLFGREQVDFHFASVTATYKLLGCRRVCTYPVSDIRQITYVGLLARGEPSLRLMLSDRKDPVAVLIGLGNRDAATLLGKIAKSYPYLASKISA
jgi:hypothetical protein